MEKKKLSKKIIIAISALVAAVILLGGAYMIWGPKGTVGNKTIAVSVVLADKSATDFIVKTDAEMLGEALLNEKLVEGEMGEYGLFITTVNGVTADAAKKEWWCVTKDGEMVNTGADTTPIADKDKFELTLSTY
ncbi:MAG: DUF4430 domain-containing protein [Oscillospiraceae bacterium]